MKVIAIARVVCCGKGYILVVWHLTTIWVQVLGMQLEVDIGIEYCFVFGGSL